jgi:hypothetical protein
MATAQNSNSGPSTVFDDSELARMVQARFPALCRVVLSVEATYTSLGLAGSAKDLIRGGFCSSRMLTQLPQCGVKRYQRPNWPYTTEVKRLRSGFRIETLYYWTSVDREKITAALGLPPDSLERAESGPAVGRPLPVLVKALTKKYPALVVKAEQVSRDGRRRQILYFNGSLADIVKSGLLTADCDCPTPIPNTVTRCTSLKMPMGHIGGAFSLTMTRPMPMTTVAQAPKSFRPTSVACCAHSCAEHGRRRRSHEQHHPVPRS